MNLGQREIANMLPYQPPLASQLPRGAERNALPVAVMRKAWLVMLAALAMIVLEGAFRKWVFTGGGTVKYLMYFSKDILFAALLLFPKRSRASASLRVFEDWLVPGCVLLGVGALLSWVHGFNLVGGFLTARACIILPMLAWLAVPRLAGLPLRWVIWLLVAFTVFNFALGAVQNRLPQDHIFNRYAADTDEIVAVESGVRACGTFAYITGLATISSIGIWAGLALISLAKNQRQRIGAWAALSAGFGCGLASVSRAPIVVGVMMVAGWMVCSRATVSALARGLVAATFCVVIAAGLGITPMFSELGQGLMQRSESANDSFNERALGPLNELVSAFQMAPLGEGFGTLQVGGYYAATGTMDLSAIESPLPRMVLETGIIGLIGYFVVCAGALLALQSAKNEAQSAGARAMLLATQMLLLPMFYGNVIFNHTASAFVWMIFAAVLAAVELKDKDKTEMLKAENRNWKAEAWGRKSRARKSPRAKNVG